MQALPSLPPPEDSTPWLRGSFRSRAESPPPVAPNNTASGAAQLTQQQRQQRQQRDEEKRLYAARNPLALLAADEASIAQRKAAIRNFGAYWIRPPGIGKTLQTMIVEEVERREQEELERQERGLLDLQAQQQLQEAQQRATETAAEDEAAQPERDLDQDVPEAEASIFEDASLEENSVAEQGQEHVFEELQEAELTGVIRDEEELGVEHERDLDESVPDAASYQRTDTEIESSGSEVETVPRVTRAQADGSPRMRAARTNIFNLTGRLQQSTTLPRSPGSIVLSRSSPHVESSFVASSPARARATRNTRATDRRH